MSPTKKKKRDFSICRFPNTFSTLHFSLLPTAHLSVRGTFPGSRPVQGRLCPGSGNKFSGKEFWTVLDKGELFLDYTTIGHHSLHDARSKTARREFWGCGFDTIYATLSHVDRSTATGGGEFPSNSLVKRVTIL